MGLTDEQRMRIEQKKAEAQAKMKNRQLTGGGGICSGQSLATQLNMGAAKPSSGGQTSSTQLNSAPIKASSGGQTLSTQLNLAAYQAKQLVQQKEIMAPHQKSLMEEKRREALGRKNMSNNTNKLPFPQAKFGLEKHSGQKSNEISKDVEMNKKTITNFYGKSVKGSCILISKTRFQVNVGFHQQMIQIFKAIDTSQYNAKDKIWTFDLKDHDQMIRKTNCLKPEVDIAPLPHWVLNTFNTIANDVEMIEIDLSSVEPTLLSQLMPFQRLGVQYGISRRCRVMIADDMGLGKTVQALALASYYRSSWPLLVVSPSSMKFGWRDAIIRWLPSVPEQEISVLTKGKDYVGDNQITIISYDLLSKKSAELRRKNYKMLILDESHMIKDHKSSRCKSAEPLMKAAKFLVMLSGTPALSRPIELYSQISGLQPQLFRFPTEFGDRYCDGKRITIGQREVPDFSGSSNMSELSLLLMERCMIRRLKSEVLKELPSKQRCMVVLDPSMVDTKSKAMENRRKEAMKNEKDGLEKRGLILEFFNETASAKLKAVQGYIKDLLSGEKKMLVFCHHQLMMNGIAETLEKINVNFIRIDGTVGSEKRKILVDKFQTHDETRVALLSITAANSGITLTAAHLVVFAELFWNPGILTQAEDRAHRIGQTDSVLVQYLVARGTADDFIWPMIQGKLEVLNKAGLSKDNFSESEAKIQEDSTQKRMEDFFNVEKSSDDQTSEEAFLWGDLCEDDFNFNTEPPLKKQRTVDPS